MGTNYYLEMNEGEVCSKCGRGDGQAIKLHIGKSSAGWPFSLHGYTGEYDDAPVPLDSWVRWTNFMFTHPQVKIFDEYGREIPKQEFIELVEFKLAMPMPHPDPGARFDSEGYRLIFQEFS